MLVLPVVVASCRGQPECGQPTVTANHRPSHSVDPTKSRSLKPERPFYSHNNLANPRSQSIVQYSWNGAYASASGHHRVPQSHGTVPARIDRKLATGGTIIMASWNRKWSATAAALRLSRTHGERRRGAQVSTRSGVVVCSIPCIYSIIIDGRRFFLRV